VGSVPDPRSQASIAYCGFTPTLRGGAGPGGLVHGFYPWLSLGPPSGRPRAVVPVFAPRSGLGSRISPVAKFGLSLREAIGSGAPVFPCF